MSIWNKLYKTLQDSNPEKFNEKIFTLKDQDNILQHVEDACKSLETVKGIKFLGCKMINERSLYRNSKVITDVPYERSRLFAIEISFELTDSKGETKKIKKKIFFPKLIDGKYYLIDNIKYYPIFQIVDAETYKTNNSITMRTSLQPIVISNKSNEIEPENDNVVISTYYTFSKIFNTKIPIFVYFFAKYGVTDTLKFFGLHNTFTIIEKKHAPDFETFTKINKETGETEIIDYLFKLGSMLYLKVPKSFIDESGQNKMLVSTFIQAFQKKDKTSIMKLDDTDYWIKKLGSYYTRNQTNFENKGRSVQTSFERLLDNTTKRIIRISENDKKDIYTLLRWFLINYSSLLLQNNDDLANKRLRLNECFIFPLLKMWTDGVLRILNGKNITLKTLESIFNGVTPDFLVKKIKTADNLRYMNNVDSIDILNTMKVTIAGNQSISNARGEIRGKTLDPSMLGNIDLIYTSNNDPGTTRSLTIGANVNETWHFTDEPNIISVGFIEEEEIETENDDSFDDWFNGLCNNDEDDNDDAF